MNTRTILVDDESPNLENLRMLLQQHCADLTIVAEAGDVDEGINAISLHQPELVFLDIHLHNRSGFDILKQVSDINFEIIFITAYDQYGIQAVKHMALDYLLKPVDILELKEAVEKARQKISLKKKNERLEYFCDFLRTGNTLPPRIALPLHDEIKYVPIEEILRCEADNSYTWFFFTSGEKALVSKTLKEYESVLSDHGFIRTHQSHLVNSYHIRSWLREDGGILLLNNQTRVPVSKINRERVKSILAKQGVM